MEILEKPIGANAASVTASAPLKVLFVSHAYVVGLNQGKLAAIAAKDDVEVALLAPQHWKAHEWNKVLTLEAPFPEIQLFPAKILFSGRVGAVLYSPLAIWQAISTFQPDILQVEHEVFSLAAFEMAIVARLANIPIVFFGWENMDRQLSSFRRWIRRFILSTANGVIAGNGEGAALTQQWGFEGLIEVMPQMGVDTQIFTPPTQPRSRTNFTVGFVGRLSVSKGVDTLIQATRLLKDRGKYIQLAICGSGPEEEALHQLAVTEGVQDQIDWRGLVRHDEVPQEMQQFDALVLPSRTVDTWKEQFGHVLIEAMATEIPVVGSTCGEIPNVIGRPDLVFAEDDAESLANILDRLLSDPVWYQETKTYFVQRVHQNYSHNGIADRLISLWRRAISGFSPA
ncbi:MULTISPECIES: glycosyltransferase [Cyanophyceae]|uniref:Glycosyltransferase n=1 Tax=Leptolyngbya subtilissima DQ-A4 TaxID=2933933 RepID=A0ABV0JZ01_9CYAN|nr:glycosyltransferase [Nodosilinea sp. FACHB-141]MBD2112392.1 glycosyltransferase [Nodosilinea sp. FACHB-141]